MKPYCVVECVCIGVGVYGTNYCIQKLSVMSFSLATIYYRAWTAAVMGQSTHRHWGICQCRLLICKSIMPVSPHRYVVNWIIIIFLTQKPRSKRTQSPQVVCVTGIFPFYFSCLRKSYNNNQWARRGLLDSSFGVSLLVALARTWRLWFWMLKYSIQDTAYQYVYMWTSAYDRGLFQAWAARVHRGNAIVKVLWSRRSQLQKCVGNVCYSDCLGQGRLRLLPSAGYSALLTSWNRGR